MQRIVPALRVKSYDASLAFYTTLGFASQWVHQFEPNFPKYGSLVCDGVELHLTEHTGDCPFGGLVNIYLADVDGYHQSLVAAGVPIAEPPSNSLGPTIRAMLVLDPDRNRLHFITRRDTTRPDQVDSRRGGRPNRS